jgi:hypothetical protein
MPLKIATPQLVPLPKNKIPLIEVIINVLNHEPTLIPIGKTLLRAALSKLGNDS